MQCLQDFSCFLSIAKQPTALKLFVGAFLMGLYNQDPND